MSNDRALTYFNGEALPASVFEKYTLRDKNDRQVEFCPDEMHRRIARELARVEAVKFKNPYNEEFIYSLLKDFGYIIPQGSPMAGIGSKQFVTLSNCYVVPPPLDSYAGIHLTDEAMTAICKRRGGVGTDISNIRPDGMTTTNAARKSTGIVPFCERFSNTIREVAQNGRRGALMLTLSVHHPQVLDFATMKLDPTKVTGANVSIRLSNEFMQAVKDGTDYEQRWPVDSKTPKFSKSVDARGVWRRIIECAHARAEPGLLFWDRIISESPADCYSAFGFATISTNPCSELPLCVLDSCRLLLLNLFAFVKNPFTSKAKFDFADFYDKAQAAQRLMDDIVDLELEAVDRIIAKIMEDPEPAKVKERELRLWQEVRAKCVQGRRTGTGITGLGDVLAAVGMRYGSDQSIAFTESIYKVLKLACYKSSVDMAKELGAFTIWSPELEKDCPFLLRIKDDHVSVSGLKLIGREIYDAMQKHGRRNIALLTTAPAGSVSLLAGPRPAFGTTSGIEPLFTDSPYVRRKKIVEADGNVKADFVDKTGDRWQHFEVFHPKLKLWMEITGEKDWTKSPYHGCTANDLDWKQRVRLQAAAQKHVDHAISSTINLPEDVSIERVAEIYEMSWEHECKGMTIYRDKCRDGVLVTSTESQATLQKTTAIKRPKDLPCDIHHATVRKEPFVVVVGKYQDAPYEVFVFANKDDVLADKKTTAGISRKVKRGQYELWTVDGVSNLLTNCESMSSLLSDTEEALARIVSAALRHGTDISFVVHQLEKARAGDLFAFSKSLARVLKKYVKDGTFVSGEKCGSCGEEALIRQEGCCVCRACGWSKC